MRMQSITTAFLLAGITPDKPDMQDCAAPMTVTGKGFAEMYPAVTKTSASLSLANLSSEQSPDQADRCLFGYGYTGTRNGGTAPKKYAEMGYEISQEKPRIGKDWNEYLQKGKHWKGTMN